MAANRWLVAIESLVGSNTVTRGQLSLTALATRCACEDGVQLVCSIYNYEQPGQLLMGLQHVVPCRPELVYSPHFLKSVGVGKQENSPARYFYYNKSFFCQLNFMEIIRLSQC